MKSMLWGAMGLVCIGWFAAGAARAADGDDVKALQERVKALEDAKVVTPPLASSWVDKFSFNDRVRTRYEMIVDDTLTGEARTRQRGRVAASFGMEYKPFDEMKAGISLSTGGTDPVSTNQTFDTDWSRKTISLEMAYIDYSPKWAKGLDLIGGKMKNPFATPANNQLIWDHDLRPEGLAATYKTDAFKPLEVFGNFGAFVVQERSAAAETLLYGVQGGASYDIPVKDFPIKVRGGLGIYDYTAVAGRTPASMGTQGSSAFGNTLAGGAFAEDFNEMEMYVAGDVTAWGIPMTAYADMVINTAASAQKTGFQMGVTAGKIKDPGSWAARLNYRDVKQDAVFGQFTDSDFVGGGTNGRGFETGFDYQVLPNTTASFTLFATTKNAATTKDDYTRLQADIQVKF